MICLRGCAKELQGLCHAYRASAPHSRRLRKSFATALTGAVEPVRSRSRAARAGDLHCLFHQERGEHEHRYADERIEDAPGSGMREHWGEQSGAEAERREPSSAGRSGAA
jgi:hypothetical protein